MPGQLLCSVIVPVYNGAVYLKECLDSVRDQQYPDWECIIIDDGSTDDSAEVAAGYLSDPRFRLLRIKNSGVSAARNAGIATSRGSLILPLDGDDRIDTGYIGECVRVFDRRPDMKLVYSPGTMFGEASGPWDLPDFNYPTMLRYNMIHNSSMYRKADYDRVGGYRENMVSGFEDWDFFIALLHGSTTNMVFRLSQSMFYYRVKDSGRRLSLQRSQKQSLMFDQIVYNNFSIYQEYFPNIFSRILEYDFDKTMLAKPPVRLVTKLLIRFSSMKRMLLKQKR